MGLNCPECNGGPVLYILTYTCAKKHQWTEHVTPAGIEDVPPPPPRNAMKMSFGKHRGEYIEDLPLDYIQWCLDNIDNLRDSLKEEMENQVILKGGGGVVRKEGKFTGTKFSYGPKKND